MLLPDEKLGADMLDALDERCLHHVSTHVYGHETKRARCWAEQQVQMVDALLGWLDRSKPGAQGDARLQGAVSLLRDHLSSARHDLDHTIQEIDETVDRRWQSRWEQEH